MVMEWLPPLAIFDLPVSLVKGAAAYHAAFPEEINARIESNQNDSQQAEAAYLDGPSAK